MPWYRYNRHFIKRGGTMSPYPLLSILKANNDHHAVVLTIYEDALWEAFLGPSNKIRVEKGSQSLERGKMVRRNKEVFQRESYVDIRDDLRRYKQETSPGQMIRVKP